MKVILLGFDGMTFNILEPYIKAGVMPNFSKVLDGGAHGILRSTIPPITGPGWTSMFTGKNPGKHGVFEFFRRNGYKRELMTRSVSSGAEPVWNILSRNRKRMIIANVPFTYPPDDINGIMYSGLMTPSTDAEFASPREIRKEILELIPDYQINVDEELTKYAKNKNVLLKQIKKITEDTRTLMNHFMGKYPWDFSFITYTGTDVMQHFWWDEIISMQQECVEIYRLMDNILGDAMEKMDDETVLVVASDHGFSGVKKVFHINNFLNKIGLLHFRNGKTIEGAPDKVKSPGLLLMAVIRMLKRLNIKEHLPESVINYIKSHLPMKQITEHNVDWEKTKVFAMAPYGNISVNLRGREPNGIVEQKDIPKLFERLKKEIMSVRDDETGENVVREVARSDHLYAVDRCDNMPDFLVDVHDGYSLSVRIGQGILGTDNMLENRKISGDHNINGMFAAYGGMINKKRLNAEIYDIAPTILYLMGSPIPKDVDGRVLTEVINDRFVRENKIIFEEVGSIGHKEENILSQEETENIKTQLKNLGYLD